MSNKAATPAPVTVPPSPVITRYHASLIRTALDPGTNPAFAKLSSFPFSNSHIYDKESPTDDEPPTNRPDFFGTILNPAIIAAQLFDMTAFRGGLS